MRIVIQETINDGSLNLNFKLQFSRGSSHFKKPNASLSSIFYIAHGYNLDNYSFF